jgi:hypothetical protein
MPRANTECTELSVGFGLLGVEPLGLSQRQVEACFENTVDAKTYTRFSEEFISDEPLYRKFYNLGQKLRNAYSVFARSRFNSIRWVGPRRQAATASIPVDLRAVNVPISIKDDSDLISNISPHKLFVSLPQGLSARGRGPNWFLENDQLLYQQLYSYAKDTWSPTFPDNIARYLSSVRGDNRKILARIIRKQELEKTPEYQGYQDIYIPMCHSVAQSSADMFNRHLQASLKGPSRNFVGENIIKGFFRLGESQYIHCGLEDLKEFAILVPDLTTWKDSWAFKSLVAEADVSPDRGQCVVNFHLTIEEKKTRKPFVAEYFTEIRWSHGRLCGQPEAKTKKLFLWPSLPFTQKLVNENQFEKIKCIGAGGFGTVYEAVDNWSGESVALKELTRAFEPFQEHEFERFKREIKLQSVLQHPNILPIITYELSSPAPWFVTPLAKSSLADLIESDPAVKADRGRINCFYLQILEGVKYAHHQNVIHRDLKSENILLFDNDLVKVGDFGLGKCFDSNSSSWGLTESGESMGTYFYTAPEQMDSFKDADYRADIFSLGKLLYYCLTGDTPFTNLNLNQVEARYAEIITKCTATDPADRFQSIDSLLESFKNTVTR